MKYTNEVEHQLTQMDTRINHVLAMMERKMECPNIVDELSSIRNTLDRVIGMIVSTNLERSVRKCIETVDKEEYKVKDAIELIIKSR